MRAWRVAEYGDYTDVLKLEQVDDLKASKGMAVVAVKAAGINFPDLLSIAGKYQIKAPLPFSPGLEAVGEVVDVGEGCNFEIGQRVICGTMWGAFAEQILISEKMAFAAPSTMSDAEAAGMLITYQTSYFALVFRSALQAGEVLLVHGGAGGVGTSAIQIGKALGATVIATAGTDEKLQVCADCGADHLINYRKSDFVAEVKKLTGGRGANVIYDPVGGDVFDQSSRCIAFEGRLIVIGFASGRIPEIKANRILLKNISVVGLNWGNYQLYNPQKQTEAQAALSKMHADGQIQPVIFREYPFEELPDALAAIKSRNSYGKIILKT